VQVEGTGVPRPLRFIFIAWMFRR